MDPMGNFLPFTFDWRRAFSSTNYNRAAASGSRGFLKDATSRGSDSKHVPSLW